MKTTVWAEENFGMIQLYDKRRTKRLIDIACRLAENKGSSLARLYDGWYDIKATYNLLKLNVMAPDIIQSTHRQLVVKNILEIMSVVALRLIDLREALRINPDGPALESGLDEFELKILGAYLKRELKTVRCVALAIGRLGGHQNRRSDGMPGLLTLWLGMSRFINILEGVKLNEKLKFEKFG